MFTSDNGMNLGHHGIWGKGNGTYPQNMYDTSVKVPFLASWKGHLPENQVCEAMCSHYDIFPTLQELLQLSGDVRQKLPGRSFLNWLEHPNGTDERSIVIVDEYSQQIFLPVQTVLYHILLLLFRPAPNRRILQKYALTVSAYPAPDSHTGDFHTDYILPPCPR